ncbi:hypothetical protein BDZ91DRAFT_754133 [Kalaharituber pfeilii]|nr:hypothetical protein BDZ91DRAFT_754133 [Kalaharituber pfeilii]
MAPASPPPPETLGFSPISTTETPEVPPRTNRKRKGKQPSPQDPYALKRQLNDKEAQKIASAPPADTSAAPPRENTPAASTGPPSRPARLGGRWLRSTVYELDRGRK